MKNSFNLLLLLFSLLLFGGCYNKSPETHDAYVKLTEHQLDSLSFQTKHHYTKNYNFIVSADSIILVSQQPEEIVSNLEIDTLAFYKHEHVAVADIRFIPTDSVDSVWIQLANDKAAFGWVHESYMIDKVYPDDPISQFIHVFSDTHIIIMLLFLMLMSGIYTFVTVRKKHVPFVHFRDIETFYPMMLCLIVAFSATLYASIQLFKPDMWRHFYYHTTLNPFSVPLLLGIFLSSIWSILIVSIAVVDDVFRRLHIVDAILYLGGVGAVCAINYVVFSITTLYYLGYLLFIAYVFLAVRQYLRHSYMPYICGNCGSRMRRKGRCSHCGTMNE